MYGPFYSKVAINFFSVLIDPTLKNMIIHELYQTFLQWLQITEMHCHNALELDRLKQFHIEQTEELKKTAKAELTQKENELKERLTSVMADYSDLKEQSRKMLDSMHSDKDVKLQVRR